MNARLASSRRAGASPALPGGQTTEELRQVVSAAPLRPAPTPTAAGTAGGCTDAVVPCSVDRRHDAMAQLQRRSPGPNPFADIAAVGFNELRCRPTVRAAAAPFFPSRAVSRCC